MREIERVADDLRLSGLKPEFTEFPVDTAYFGGGSPTLAGAEWFGKIVAALKARFHFVDDAEVTLETTPGSADDAFLARARALGVNRLSIGAQSFEDRELRAVGRLHTADETRDLVARARRVGFTDISLDLIAGLPYQTVESWRSSLAATAQLAPEHSSVYLFEVDEKSRLGNEVLQFGTRYHAASVPGEDFCAEAYETAQKTLGNAGYVQYEISNFARPGHESRHNRKYWRLEPYIGLGAGAHSFDGERRWMNDADPEAYGAKIAEGISPVCDVRFLTRDEQLEEFFFLGLRQCGGVDLEFARRRWGNERVNEWAPKISRLVDSGWLESRNGRILLPERAYLVSNEIFQEFVS